MYARYNSVVSHYLVPVHLLFILFNSFLTHTQREHLDTNKAYTVTLIE
jgi:hypothetical protein